MSTAVACVREIFPDAAITTTRRQPREDAGVSHPSVVISVDGSATERGGNNAAPGRRRSSSSTISSVLSSSEPAADVLWSAQQKNLYEKYPKKRRRSIKDIRKSLSAFREQLLVESETETETDDAGASAADDADAAPSHDAVAAATTTTTAAKSPCQITTVSA